MSVSIDENVNFEAAENWLRQAKDAHAAGDVDGYIAARYLLAVALSMTGAGDFRLHTEHLKAS
jgi:hypothetical protein